MAVEVLERVLVAEMVAAVVVAVVAVEVALVGVVQSVAPVSGCRQEAGRGRATPSPVAPVPLVIAGSVG